MYEDSWYSFVPEVQHGRSTQGPGHRRRESLLQQPSSVQSANVVEPLDKLYEEETDEDEEGDLVPAHAAALIRHVRSFPLLPRDLVRIEAAADTVVPHTVLTAKAAVAVTTAQQKSPKLSSGRGRDAIRRKHRKNMVKLEALVLDTGSDSISFDWLRQHEKPALLDAYEAELLVASRQEFMTYRDKLTLTERHLGKLVEDTDGALRLLSLLADSFRTVEQQTTSFQAQCDDLLSEQRRLQKLADDVGTDLHYYAYLDSVTRRLNAPGASRLVDDEDFSDILINLDACIAFMARHTTYRDAESYMARYQALLTKALHLLEVGFNARLEKISVELSKQITATQSESARHSLAYGRFEEILVDASYALVPNVQRVVAQVYGPTGAARQAGAAAVQNAGSGSSDAVHAIYANTANSLFRVYLGWRDQDLKPLVQKELEAFRMAAKVPMSSALDSAASPAPTTSLETAARSYIKQSFERAYLEAQLFARVFAVVPQYSTEPDAAFATVRAHRGELINGANIAPLAAHLQAALATAGLGIVCHILGWISHEYLLREYDDEYDNDDNDNLHDGDETGRMIEAAHAHSRQLAARLLAEHLWAFADALFEADITKTITRVPIVVDELAIVPAASGQPASANAYPPVRRALELLVQFDQAMPKERCQRDSPVVFRIVRETILALNRAEARIKAHRTSTDADLFLIKNLLVLKNELLSLEIGDIRSNDAGMQHFGQIWDALSLAQDWVGYFSSFVPGGTVLWARARGSEGGSAVSVSAIANGNTTKRTIALQPPGDQDVGEQLDEALRRSINGFTERWAKQLHEATSRKLGGKNVAKLERELDELLQAAFRNQPEVMAKLKEAIQIQMLAQEDKQMSTISQISRG